MTSVAVSSLSILPDGGAQTLPRVSIETEYGTIEVVVDTVRAPITGVNFLRYVDQGFYDGGRFFRTVTLENQPNDSIRIEVIQGGMDTSRTGQRFPPIPLEPTRTTGLRHLNGTISMARGTPDTATSSFFICIGDQPSLDFGGHRNPDGLGFGAFGVVTTGMEVVTRIHRSPAEAQNLQPTIAILRARRVS